MDEQPLRFEQYLETATDLVALVRTIAADLTPEQRLMCLKVHPEAPWDFEGLEAARSAFEIIEQLKGRVGRWYDHTCSLPDLTQSLVALYHQLSPEYRSEGLRYLCDCPVSMLAMGALASLEPLEPVQWELVRELLLHTTRCLSTIPYVPAAASHRLRVALLSNQLREASLYMAVRLSLDYVLDPSQCDGLLDTVRQARDTARKRAAASET